MLLLYYGNRIERNVNFDTGFANKRRLTDMKCLIRKNGELMCSAMLALLTFLGPTLSAHSFARGKSQQDRLWQSILCLWMFSGHLARQTAFLKVVRPSWRSLFVVCMVNHHTRNVNKLRNDLTRQKFHRESAPPLSSSVSCHNDDCH